MLIVDDAMMAGAGVGGGVVGASTSNPVPGAGGGGGPSLLERFKRLPTWAKILVIVALAVGVYFVWQFVGNLGSSSSPGPGPTTTPNPGPGPGGGSEPPPSGSTGPSQPTGTGTTTPETTLHPKGQVAKTTAAIRKNPASAAQVVLKGKPTSVQTASGVHTGAPQIRAIRTGLGGSHAAVHPKAATVSRNQIAQHTATHGGPPGGSRKGAQAPKSTPAKKYTPPPQLRGFRP